MKAGTVCRLLIDILDEDNYIWIEKGTLFKFDPDSDCQRINGELYFVDECDFEEVE